MAYATVSDVQGRMTRTLDAAEQAICTNLLADAALIIDSYNADASASAKSLVSCHMVIRAMGDGDIQSQAPIGASQGTVSALGYSQSWTLSSGGSVGELYLTRLDKRLLGALGRITYIDPYTDPEAADD